MSILLATVKKYLTVHSDFDPLFLERNSEDN